MNQDRALGIGLTALVVIVGVITISTLIHSTNKNTINLQFAKQGYHQEQRTVCSRQYTELLWIKDTK